MRPTFLLLAALCLGGTDALAQDSTKADAVNRILPSQPVRVLKAGETFRGSFLANRSDSLFLVRDGERLGFSYAEVQGIKVRQSSRSRGMLIGWLVGVISTANLVEEGEPGAIFVGSVFGAFLGSVVGSAITRWPQVYPGPSSSEKPSWGPLAEKTLSIALRAGYSTSDEFQGNEGFSGSVTVLARNDHVMALGGELGHYPFAKETVTDEFGTEETSGRTTAITLESRFRPTHGHLRPTLNLGVGPYIDIRKVHFEGMFGVQEDTETEWKFGAHIGPGVQIGSGDWAAAVEGRYHVVGGRGFYSDFLTITAGVTWH